MWIRDPIHILKSSCLHYSVCVPRGELHSHTHNVHVHMIYLCKFWLSISSWVLISVTPCKLKITIYSTNHEQLLVLNGNIRCMWDKTKIWYDSVQYNKLHVRTCWGLWVSEKNSPNSLVGTKNSFAPLWMNIHRYVNFKLQEHCKCMLQKRWFPNNTW